MTNRDKLMQQMARMSANQLARYLSETVSSEVNDRLCKQCLKAHGGQCIMEMQDLENCPKKIAD